MNILLGIIVGLIVLVVLVTAHELGHFLMAKRNGVEVEEFGICFPPRAIAWRKVDGKWRRLEKSEWEKAPGEGTIISLNWLPIGGFCQMKGESDAAATQGSFGRASLWQKTKILFGGVLANWLVAFLVLTFLALVGMPHLIKGQFAFEGDTTAVGLMPVTVTAVEPGSPAALVGIQEGDELKSIRALVCEDEECAKRREEKATIGVASDLIDFDKAHAGQTVYLSYQRDGEVLVSEIKLNTAEEKYILGVNIESNEVYVSTWSAPVVGLLTTAQLTGETFRGLGQLVGNLFSGIAKQFNGDEAVRESGSEEIKEAGDAVSGPVGIVGVLFPAFMQSGGRYLLFLMALISVSLACMNVLPIPALDGGRWLLIMFYRLRGKKLEKETEERIVGRAFMVILAIAAIVTALDVMRIFR